MATPTRPLPNSASEPGSGTGFVGVSGGVVPSPEAEIMPVDWKEVVGNLPPVVFSEPNSTPP